MNTIIRCKREKNACKTAVFVCIVLFLSASLFAEDRIHTLQSGETIYGIAREYGVKVEEILFINGIEDARKAQVGQKLRIPSGPIQASYNTYGSSGIAAVPPIYREHIAKKGDTLFGIARLYNTNITELRRLNSFSANYVLKIGDRIKVASGAQGTAPTTVVYSNNSAAVPKIQSSKGFDYSASWPVRVKTGGYLSGKLSGVVLTTTKSEPVKSIATGTVISAGPYRGYGRVAIVQSPEGYLYVYAGCEKLIVKAGDKVHPGTEVGRVGIDSVSGKAELFFMVYKNNNPIDPAIAPRS